MSLSRWELRDLWAFNHKTVATVQVAGIDPRMSQFFAEGVCPLSRGAPYIQYTMLCKAFGIIPVYAQRSYRNEVVELTWAYGHNVREHEPGLYKAIVDYATAENVAYELSEEKNRHHYAPREDGSWFRLCVPSFRNMGRIKNIFFEHRRDNPKYQKQVAPVLAALKRKTIKLEFG